ncbi:MAG TPA: hypothetical protein VFM49_21000 [Chloroflexia bacterium]|nr:hypothetical protein [Chloroflexia bacterium]
MPPAPNPSEIYCPRCGAANDAALPRCLLCGTPLTAPDRARAAVPPVAPPIPPPVYAPPPVQAAYAPAPVPAPPPMAAPPGYPALQAPPYLPPGYVPHPPPGYVPPATPAPGPPVVAPSPYAGYPPPAVPLPHRSGLRIGVALGLLFSVCVITLLSGSALAVIWGGSMAPVVAPPPPDSTLLLDQAADAHAQLKSVHYQLTAEFPGAAGGGSDLPRQVMMDGDVIFPDSYTMHSTVYGERIVLGDTVYRRAAGSATWQRVGPDTPDQNAPVSATDLLTVVKYYDTADPAEEVISGTRRLVRVHFTVDTQRMAADEGPDAAVAALAGSDVQATALIDEATRYITRLTLRIVTPDNARGNFTLILSRFDAPVTIKPPPNSSP